MYVCLRDFLGKHIDTRLFMGGVIICVFFFFVQDRSIAFVKFRTCSGLTYCNDWQSRKYHGGDLNNEGNPLLLKHV